MSGETGVVKFRCEHIAREVVEFSGLAELNKVRRTLLQLRMIGVDGSGIGYGNLSVRAEEPGCFYITASGTGGVRQLLAGDVAKVTAFDLAANWLRCEGRGIASSESLTHAAIYGAAADVRAVIHCHSERLWERLCAGGVATGAEAEYGTPAMAAEVQRLFGESDVRQRGIFAMRGHHSGVVAFGERLEAALAVLLSA